MALSTFHVILLAFAVVHIPGCLADDSSNSSEQKDDSIGDMLESIVDGLWGNYKTKYNRNYDDEKDTRKKSVFQSHLSGILTHNTGYSSGKNTYQQGVNKYATVDHDSFVHNMNGFNLGLQQEKQANITASGKKLQACKSCLLRKSFKTPNVTIPASIDWRTKGAVTPVKDQGKCGSCYTFSATGAIEGQAKLKKGKLIDLSEQNLVDCSKPQGNSGCDGGIMDNAFEYVHDAGINFDATYPYKDAEGNCLFKKKNVGANITGIVNIPAGDEEALKKAVGTMGPVSVAIDASNPSFQFYQSGVYFEPACSPDNVDHGVLCVGYGSENGQDYWLVKNSWGTDWGIEGYIKIARNKDNHCGIASIASYPLM